MKNYNLIYYFLTIPICKDPTIITKIMQMLTDNINMHSLQSSTNSDMAHYERLVTEMHFKKLILLSKLVIACFDGQFKRVETNAKRISG